MTFSLDDNATRQTICNAYVDAIDGGSGDATGDILIRNSTTTLVAMNFANPAYGAATSADPSVAALASGLSGTASAGSGTSPDNYQIRNRDNTVLYSGSCGVGSGDISFDGTITSGQLVEIDTLNFSLA